MEPLPSASQPSNTEASSAAAQEHPDKIEPADPAEVQELLGRFWRQLAGLERLAPRAEYLLLQELIDDLRRTVISLMLALNGIKRPAATEHLNRYLGESQQRAVNSTLTLPAASREAYIGQAVSLVVIYRWYAPQLTARYSLTYPAALEAEVWQRLRAALFDWPATITTDDPAS